MQLRRTLLQAARDEAVLALAQHRGEIDLIAKTLPAGKGRERLVKALIAIAGAVVALVLVGGNHSLIALIVAALTAMAVFAYSSDEMKNLANSLAMHNADVERLAEQLQQADKELHSLPDANEPRNLP